MRQLVTLSNWLITWKPFVSAVVYLMTSLLHSSRATQEYVQLELFLHMDDKKAMCSEGDQFLGVLQAHGLN